MQFRLFVDGNGVDVVRGLYRDLTGQNVRRSSQVENRAFVVEPYDLCVGVNYCWRGDLPVASWLASLNGRKEFAWFSWDDPLPFLIAWARPTAQA
ncbi:hypothetical protein [Bradyrhizobium sp. DASA03120]|uniref:hypothetical protein n=1 Tax=Bradyrhizobium sp. SMVTL-02 TaxID=3395917 RepID=UPI003F6E775E